MKRKQTGQAPKKPIGAKTKLPKRNVYRVPRSSTPTPDFVKVK